MNEPTNLNVKKVRLIVEGRVQGVGFRYTTKQVADRIGVYGIVRNENDGSVYIEVNGDPNKVDDFIEEIRHSPSPSGKVNNVTLEEDASIEERIKFSITN
ncbi:acylphosphatase [Desemzia sp. C1]|uniref:acylphosphatase n=1 Tax=Desemzia sp. C1 TaxID=2892016 RepID=UPI001E3D0E71|nr:acylphosphatase [Desemzia sp. C1]MCI3029315.1 acylphosphatase [Desemzia sp. C1]